MALNVGSRLGHYDVTALIGGVGHPPLIVMPLCSPIPVGFPRRY
jgi:hypothetical protein